MKLSLFRKSGNFFASCLFILLGMLLSAAAITLLFYRAHPDPVIFMLGAALLTAALIWLFLLLYLFGKQLSDFTAELCGMMGQMADGSFMPNAVYNQETQLARIKHQLLKLYEIMQEGRRKIDREHENLMTLISDISHQIKTPVSNLKMVTDTLLSKNLPRADQMDFLNGIRTETEKLDFLFQSMIKASRLETGIIRLVKTKAPLYPTVAQAMSGILYSAERKNIHADVSCPDNLLLSHDSKWTAEALFNLLDNAVKYTPCGGRILVRVSEGEMYTRIDITDTGIGIPEEHQAAIFKRFYREEQIHDEPGVGIGLYLSREIVAKQGGYIKVDSAPQKGSTFSVFLPAR